MRKHYYFNYCDNMKKILIQKNGIQKLVSEAYWKNLSKNPCGWTVVSQEGETITPMPNTTQAREINIPAFEKTPEPVQEITTESPAEKLLAENKTEEPPVKTEPKKRTRKPRKS